jgi:hypothetical protein
LSTDFAAARKSSVSSLEKHIRYPLVNWFDDSKGEERLDSRRTASLLVRHNFSRIYHLLQALLKEYVVAQKDAMQKVVIDLNIATSICDSVDVVHSVGLLNQNSKELASKLPIIEEYQWLLPIWFFLIDC